MLGAEKRRLGAAAPTSPNPSREDEPVSAGQPQGGMAGLAMDYALELLRIVSEAPVT